MATLYHATSYHEAEQISREDQMRCGNHGFAGAGIYFSSNAEAACRKAKNGRGPADIVLECEVRLGRVADEPKNTVNGQWCRARGYDSVKISGLDVYAVYDSWRVTVRRYRRRYDSQWYPSMDALHGRNASGHNSSGLQFYGRESHSNVPTSSLRHNSSGLQFRERESIPYVPISSARQPRPSPPAEDCCFPAHATVELLDGRSVIMSNLTVGDCVATLKNDGTKAFSEVYAFGHADLRTTTAFKVLSLENGSKLRLTAEHLLPVEDRATAAGRRFCFAMDVAVGDYLFTLSGLSRVTKTEALQMKGLFAPFTVDGTLLVDNVLVSCYATLHNQKICHLALAPLRALYRSGLGPTLASLTRASGEVAYVRQSASEGAQLKGAHPYIDSLYRVLPLVRALGL